MKKIICVCVLGCCAGGLWAAGQTVDSTSAKPLAMYLRPTAEQRKIFKQRNKEIRYLVRQYHKANAQDKQQIKEQLTQIVSAATEESLEAATQRLEAEKANLAQWEKTLQQRQARKEELKARRVEEILSGEAKRRYQLARKRWKKEMKDLKKSMK